MVFFVEAGICSTWNRRQRSDNRRQLDEAFLRLRVVVPLVGVAASLGSLVGVARFFFAGVLGSRFSNSKPTLPSAPRTR